MVRSMRLILLTFAILLNVRISGQELLVKSMKAAPIDLSASTYERKDLTGEACGLVKVQLAATGAQFEGNVIGQVEYRTGEYWVYMTQGSYMLRIKHPDIVPLDVNFRDYGVSGVDGKVTYTLTLLMPQTGGPAQKQKLIVNYSPATAMVIVDSKVYREDGHLEVDLPVGEHTYVIAEHGYESVEATIKLKGGSPRTISESLVRISTPQTQSPVSSGANFQTKILRNGIDDKSESNQFYNGDDLYLSFRSPVNGYLAVYLVDAENQAYCLLPYRNQASGIYPIKAHQRYLFFNAKEAPLSERSYVDEYIMTCNRSKEQNQIYIIFSPNQYAKATDNSISDQLPRELSFDNFQGWLAKCRKNDVDMSVTMIPIMIKK